MNGLFAELRRRNVFRVAAAYAVVGWLITQAIALVEEPLALPGWTDTLVIVLLLAGLPIALLLAWAFEMTPDGIKPTQAVSAEDSVTATTGKQLDYVIIAALGLVIVLIIGGRFLPSTGPSSTTIAATSQQSVLDKSIAVLPFADFSPDSDHEWFADGLTEEILNSLARTPDLLVASRTSSFAYKGSTEEIPIIAETLGVAHILEGSVRRAGDRLRVTAQLIRASDGFHLWSDNFDASENDMISIQEEIAIEIAQTLETAMDPEALANMVEVGTDSIDAYEAYLEGLSHRAEFYSTGNPEMFSVGLEAFEIARGIDPDFADAHFEAANMYETQLSITSMGGRNDIDFDETLRLYLDRLNAAIASTDNPVSLLEYRAERSAILFDIDQTIELRERFLEARPNDIRAHGSLVNAYVFASRYEEAQTLSHRMADLPHNLPEFYDAYLTSSVWARNYDDALKMSREVANLDNPSVTTLYQAHRAMLWAGEVEEAAELLPAILASPTFQEESKLISHIRQACAEGDRMRAEPLAEALLTIGDRPSAWHGYHLMGDRESARQIVAQYDRASPPHLSAQWLFYPYFDHTVHPNLMALLEREGIERPEVIDLPFACPPA